MTSGSLDPPSSEDSSSSHLPAAPSDPPPPPLDMIDETQERPHHNPPAPPPPRLQIGDRCHVQWRNGEALLPAEVLERRPSRQTRRASRKRQKVLVDPEHKEQDAVAPTTTTVTAAATTDDSPPQDLEYYVHYIGHDRRLDEWISYDKFQLDTLENDSTTAAINLFAGGGGGTGPTPTPSTALVDQSVPLQQPPTTSSSGARRRGSASAVVVAASPSSSSLFGEAVSGGTSEPPPDSELPASVTGGSGGGNWHPQDPTFEREHDETTKVKNIERLVMGGHEVECWYYSGFPEEYSPLRTLYVCEYCLTYMKKVRTYLKHRADCTCRNPPGRRIYHEGDLAAYEIDGKDHKAYCQKLCLLAKLFLDHKTLYYDVNPFLFYIVCKVDQHGSHMVGYFSKEKVSDQGYNLACILTLPQYQKNGYGKFIISLSYELTKREGKTGSPEKPLSDLGKVSYRSYWTHILLNLLHDHDTSTNVSINDMSERTGIRMEDIISTLQSLDMIKVWKGQHVVYVKQSVIREYVKLNKQFRLCKPEFLEWQPPT